MATITGSSHLPVLIGARYIIDGVTPAPHSLGRLSRNRVLPRRPPQGPFIVCNTGQHGGLLACRRVIGGTSVLGVYTCTYAVS